MARGKRKSFFQIFLYSSLSSLILILILSLIVIGLLKTLSREREINKEIIALEKEIKKLEGEKSNLLEVLEYLKSDFYKEKEAREKFGMQKPGEKAIVILPAEEIQEEREKEISIPRKWWHFLFK